MFRIAPIPAVAVLCAGIALLVCGAAGAAPDARIEFNRDVRPILAENCFACHGPDRAQRKANLRLDQRPSAIECGAITPGRPERSKLVARIQSTQPAEVMPPPASHRALTAAERALLIRWVKQGAEYQEHWAYIVPKRPAVPALNATRARAVNTIDSFIFAKLEQKHVQPSPEAGRAALLRRLSLDLTGLPPTPEQVAAFIADRSPAAYEKQVDRLLASVHYGERMAVPWLDLVRYADTVGFHGDQNMDAWPFRDYVVDSFNANKPFDRFTIEQIAGDLLPDPTPEMLTATCQNRLNMVTREGGAQPKEYLAKYAADRVRTVSMTWLGSTMGCCECHDHKYDPFKTKDFYSMEAFFADIRQWGVYADYGYTPNPDLRGVGNDHPFPPEIRVQSRYLQQRIERDRAAMRALAAAAPPASPEERAAFDSWRTAAAAFLRDHQDGWETAQGGRVEIADSPGFHAQPDGRIEPDPAAAIGLTLRVRSGLPSIASVALTILPGAGPGGSIVRGALTPPMLTLKATFVSAAGKRSAIAFRYAGAEIYEPRYSNGFEVRGVQAGWRLSPAHLGEPNVSVWQLAAPAQLAPDDRIELALAGPKLTALRVGLSPFAPEDPDRPAIPAALANALQHPDDPASRPELLLAYLQSTGWNRTAFAALRPLESEIVQAHGGTTHVMVTQSWTPAVTRVLARGNWQDESGEIVQPAIPAFLATEDTSHAKAQSREETQRAAFAFGGHGARDRLAKESIPSPAFDRPAASAKTQTVTAVRGGAPDQPRRLTRLDLANWIVSPENPLTARVYVDRLWKMLYGTGLSDQVEDFGTQGEIPTHPELLDWLAVEFRESGWDVKHMVKLIVMSATYRQSSQPRPELKAIDPANRLYALQNARRLDAEFVRDNALAISGLLNEDVGGPPCKPYQPAGYYANIQFPSRDYIADKDDRQWRRGLYTHWQRTFLHPMLANFGAPSREDCTAIRAATNTPQQALTLLNDPAFLEAARHFADRLASVPGDAPRIDLAYRIALCRAPTQKESRSLLEFLRAMREAYRQRPDDAAKLLTIGVSPADTATDKIEQAAWTSVCRVILNLHETITRY
ncbi:MAG TPA: PSD1 and planctomycete cytochrome C domain-containing protein [Chthonomonadaceae bacterium]|nr:PSD1 and planctomycete cytochrome C domain-containing protein [Chthonomonadaceae bacterium]